MAGASRAALVRQEGALHREPEAEPRFDQSLLRASRSASSRAYDSPEESGRTGNATHASPASARARTLRARASRWPGAQTVISASRYSGSETRSGSESAK